MKTRKEKNAMPRCDTCGNEYEHCFEIIVEGRSHLFDSFECAIHILAPVCSHCGCRIIGHGTERAGALYCCDHCARHANSLVQEELENA